MKSFLRNLFAPKTSHKAPGFRPSLETLEGRSLMSAFGGLPPLDQFPQVNATLSQGVLRVNGTWLPDMIAVRQSAGQISVSGVAGTFNAALVSRIEVNGGNGNDFIRLDSELTGGQPILKPAIVNGGAGDDFIVGGYGNDFLYGGAGNDTLIGGAGHDLIDGGTGRDRATGGLGNDRIIGDFHDYVLAGQANYDTIKFENLDPSPLVSGNANMMKTVLQMGLAGKSFSDSKDGEKITVSHFEVLNVTIVDGVTTVQMKARMRYQKTRGFPQFSETGSVRFTVQPQLSATLVEAQVQSASIRVANSHVQEVNLNNVPNWLDNTSEVRAFLNAKLAALPPINFTNELKIFLLSGGSLGPQILA